MKNKRVLITGAGGFAAGHLIDYLSSLKSPVDIHALYRQRFAWSSQSRVTPHAADITHRRSLEKVVAQVKPDIIIHLAGISSVARSWEEPQKYMRVNYEGGLNLLEAMRASKTHARLLLVSSAEEYAPLSLYAKKPLSENAQIHPQSPYGISKAALTHLALAYARSYDLPVLIARPFSHAGPGQSPHFVVSDFARQIAIMEKKVKRGAKDLVIKVGNLSSVRDISDVRDVVRAYWMLALKGKSSQIYNICSGNKVSISDILRFYIQISKVPARVVADPAKTRTSDAPVYWGDCRKIKKLTGWAPRYSLESTLEDVLRYWRKIT